jgi:hypothetical protein
VEDPIIHPETVQHDSSDAPRESSTLGIIITYLVFGLFATGILIVIFTHLDHARRNLIFECTAVFMALLFLMARYIVYSVRKEKQKPEYLAHHDEPIR